MGGNSVHPVQVNICLNILSKCLLKRERNFIIVLPTEFQMCHAITKMILQDTVNCTLADSVTQQIVNTGGTW